MYKRLRCQSCQRFHLMTTVELWPGQVWTLLVGLDQQEPFHVSTDMVFYERCSSWDSPKKGLTKVFCLREKIHKHGSFFVQSLKFCTWQEKNDQLVAKGIQFLSHLPQRFVSILTYLELSLLNLISFPLTLRKGHDPISRLRSTAATQWPQSPFEVQADLRWFLMAVSPCLLCQDPNVLSGICEKVGIFLFSVLSWQND